MPLRIPGRGRGRPKKYGRASRPVTVTLPEDVIARLGGVDGDIGRAIVAIAERHPTSPSPEPESAALANYGNHAVIVVTPVKALRRLRGVELVPIGNGRALISFEDPQSIPQLELDIRDALEEGGVTARERRALEGIADILRHARLAPQISLEKRTIIVLERKPSRRSQTTGVSK